MQHMLWKCSREHNLRTIVCSTLWKFTFSSGNELQCSRWEKLCFHLGALMAPRKTWLPHSSVSAHPPRNFIKSFLLGKGSQSFRVLHDVPILQAYIVDLTQNALRMALKRRSIKNSVAGTECERKSWMGDGWSALKAWQLVMPPVVLRLPVSSCWKGRNWISFYSLTSSSNFLSA